MPKRSRELYDRELAKLGSYNGEGIGYLPKRQKRGHIPNRKYIDKENDATVTNRTRKAKPTKPTKQQKEKKTGGLSEYQRKKNRMEREPLFKKFVQATARRAMARRKARKTGTQIAPRYDKEYRAAQAAWKEEKKEEREKKKEEREKKKEERKKKKEETEEKYLREIQRRDREIALRLKETGRTGKIALSDKHARYNAKERLKYRENAQYKFMKVARARILYALNGSNKSGRTRELVGCSVAELMKHLEDQFEDGMSFDNHGAQRKGGPRKWNVDHEIPCTFFDLSKPQHQKVCFHFENLQPLWFVENMRKLNKVPPKARFEEILNKIKDCDVDIEGIKHPSDKT